MEGSTLTQKGRYMPDVKQANVAQVNGLFVEQLWGNHAQRYVVPH